MKKTITAASLLGLILAGPGADGRAQDAPEEAGNILVGKITHQDGVPVSSATVRAFHLGSERLFTAITTPETGSYLLPGLPDGDYEMSVQLQEGIYFAPELLVLSGGVRTIASFSLESGTLPAALGDRLRKRGLKLDSSLGIARLETVDRGKPFWATGPGVATLVLGAAAGAVILNEALKDEDGSPFGP